MICIRRVYIIGSNKASWLVGSDMTLRREFRSKHVLELSKASFISPRIIILLLVSKAFSIFLLRESKKIASTVGRNYLGEAYFAHTPYDSNYCLFEIRPRILRAFKICK